MKTKKVPLVYTVQGEPADGYRVTEVTSSVSTVTLAGYQAMLEGITSVTIDSADLDVSDLTEQKQFEVNLTDYLPEGISIYGSEEAIITVDVEALEQRTFKLTLGTEVEILNKNAGLLYNFSTDSVNLQIIGLPEDLNSLSVSTIIASANMSGLGEGTHQVVVDITLPDALTLATPVTTVVTITAPTEAPTTTAEDAEASSEETETSGESTTENGTEESQ